MRFLSEEDYGYSPFWQLFTEWGATCLQMLMGLLPWQHQPLSLWLQLEMQHLAPAPSAVLMAASAPTFSSCIPATRSVVLCLRSLTNSNICRYLLRLWVHGFVCCMASAKLRGWCTGTFLTCEKLSHWRCFPSPDFPFLLFGWFPLQLQSFHCSMPWTGREYFDVLIRGQELDW